MYLALVLAGCSGAMSPNGDAGENQTVTLGETVTLDGTQSDKKNGDSLKYTWTIVSAPTGSQAALDDPRSAKPTFTPDMVGTYIFELVVDNDYHDSEPVKVTVKCLAAGEVPPKEFASDPSGEVVLYDLEIIENSRDAAKVNFSLRYILENTGEARVDIGFFVYGVDAEGFDVFEREIKAGIDPGERREAVVSFGEALTIEEYDSITVWEADPITVYE
jgi:hypothetical protein